MELPDESKQLAAQTCREEVEQSVQVRRIASKGTSIYC